MDALQKHLSKAGKARWAKRTKEERIAHSKKMLVKRWPKKEKDEPTDTQTP